ncbi:MAG: glycoside hydrolase [Chloroflexaceae bacterium]|nr:glycoside hydrolase [Chloroflexaceae bacterium]
MHSWMLNQNWQMQPVDAFAQGNDAHLPDAWLPANVPGHWQQHPSLKEYTGRVVYRCQFGQMPEDTALLTLQEQYPAQSLRAWLRVQGVFYWSQGYLNGTSLGRRHEGYFIPYEHEITDRLHSENTLLMEIECPDEPSKLNKRTIMGIFSHWDCFDPRFNPGGIWLPITVHYSGPIRLKSVRCHTTTLSDRLAQLEYITRVDSTISGPVRLRWTIAPRTFTGQVQVVEQQRTLQAGSHEIRGLFKVYDPHLWWTHDLGDPDLYTITLEIWYNQALSDQISFDFGIRRFTMQDWIPYLNGVRFFIKGNNYAPTDMYIATTSAERCQQDMDLARACHCNMLRVHAHVDHPILYDTANRAGILLWQDMPLQWLYRPAILPEARRQARAMVRLLYNHPSVVVWCMHNEPIYVHDTADESLPMRLRSYASTFGFSWNRDVMDTQLKRVAEQEDPTRFVVRSSGEFHIPGLRAGTDTHIYCGWYQAYGSLQDAERMIEHLRGNLRFVTEFGAQSFPNLESCLRFMPAELDQINIADLDCYHGFQSNVLRTWVDWQQAQSLEELIQMTQDYQIMINRYYVDRLRYRKYQPTGGIVAFLFADPYPAILWSVIDYWRVPKRSYDALKMAFSPQYAFTIVSSFPYQVGQSVDIPIYVVNDARHAVRDLTLEACLLAPDDSELALVKHIVSLDPDCPTLELDRLRLKPIIPGTYTVLIQMHGGAEVIDQTYAIEVAQPLALPDPRTAQPA